MTGRSKSGGTVAMTTKTDWEFTEETFTDQRAAEQAILAVGADPRGAAIMKEKAVFKVVRLRQVPLRAAHILKQTFLSKGGEAAVSRDVSALRAEATDMLLMGTLAQYRAVLATLRRQPFGLSQLAAELEKFLGKR
jgi:hypothetical protein